MWMHFHRPPRCCEYDMKIPVSQLHLWITIAWYYPQMKQKDFLSDFIGSQARARLLRIFMFNETESFSQALVAKRAGITTQVAKRAMHELEQQGIITKSKHMPMPVLQNGKLIKKQSLQKSEIVWTVNMEFEHYRI